MPPQSAASRGVTVAIPSSSRLIGRHEAPEASQSSRESSISGAALRSRPTISYKRPLSAFNTVNNVQTTSTRTNQNVIELSDDDDDEQVVQQAASARAQPVRAPTRRNVEVIIPQRQQQQPANRSGPSTSNRSGFLDTDSEDDSERAERGSISSSHDDSIARPSRRRKRSEDSEPPKPRQRAARARESSENVEDLLLQPPRTSRRAATVINPLDADSDISLVIDMPTNRAARRNAAPAAGNPTRSQRVGSSMGRSYLESDGSDDDERADILSAMPTLTTTDSSLNTRNRKGKQRATSKTPEHSTTTTRTKRKREGGFEGTALLGRRGSASNLSSDIEIVEPVPSKKSILATQTSRTTNKPLFNPASPLKEATTHFSSISTLANDDIAIGTVYIIKPYDLDAELECAICMEIMISPVNVSCGHTFCQGCVEPWLAANAKACPTCRKTSECNPARSYVTEGVIKKHLAAVYTALEQEGKHDEAATAKAARAQLEADAEKGRIAVAAAENRRRAEAEALQRRMGQRQQPIANYMGPGRGPAGGQRGGGPAAGQYAAMTQQGGAAHMQAAFAQIQRALGGRGDLQQMAAEAGMTQQQLMQLMAQ